MVKGHRSMSQDRLKAGLIAAVIALAMLAAGVTPVRAQERELMDPTATSGITTRGTATLGTASLRNATLESIAAELTDGGGVLAESRTDGRERGIYWGPVLRESMLFLTAQHLTRFTEDRTVRELGGPFLNDWFDSVQSMDRFGDGGHTFTNWLAHPGMGSVTAHILGQNDPDYMKNKVGSGDRYWRAKGKQLIFATAYSVQFEIGPVSESSLGNIHQAAIDLVLTPTLGTMLSVGEDLVAQHVLLPMRAKHRITANTLTVLLNPTRSFANVLAFKKPWACEAASCY
jgi:hypothetical protein